MHADEDVGPDEVGEVDACLELVAGADPAALLEAGIAVAVDVAPGRTGAPEIGVVVPGQRDVGVTDHHDADSVRDEPVPQALRDREGQRLLGQLHPALGRVRDAPVQAAAVAWVDGHDDRSRVGLVHDAVRSRCRLDEPGRLARHGRRLDRCGRRRGFRGARRGIGAAAGQDGDEQRRDTDDAKAVRHAGAGSGALGGLDALRQADEELGVVLGLAEALHEELDSLVRAEGAQHPTHRPHHPQLVLVEEQLLAAGA